MAIYISSCIWAGLFEINLTFLCQILTENSFGLLADVFRLVYTTIGSPSWDYPVADARGALDQLSFFINVFIRMLKNKAQIARESIKTTL